MKTVINIKADKEVKENAQKVAQELGLPLSVVINAFLKDFIRNRGVAFSAIPRMTSTLENLLGKVEEDIAENKNMSKAFSSAEEANEYLDNL
ncbi:MAG: type II toxin-antitoxin system RelB/DinJ family antitoxin [Candidatus Paceibacterota bacterium]